ncbi:MAG: hypothetical protein ABIT96_04480, partial [Ferruginibacter sp.]
MHFTLALGFFKASAVVFLGLLYYTAFVSVIFLCLRNYMRRHRETDKNSLRFFESWRSKTLDKLMLFFTFLGKHIFLIPFNLALIFTFILFKKDPALAQSLFFVAITSLVLMFFLKHIFRRKRPPEPVFHAARGNSFPSGHAIMAINVFGFLWYVCAMSLTNNILQVGVGVMFFAIILL